MKKSIDKNSISFKGNIALLIIGIVPMIFAYIQYGKVKQNFIGKIYTAGIVIDNVMQQGPTAGLKGSGGIQYHPVIRFEDINGKTVEFTSKLGTGGILYEKGTKLSVIYDSYDSQKAEFKNIVMLCIFPVILFFAGLPFFLLSIIRLIAALLKKGGIDRYLTGG